MLVMCQGKTRNGASHMSVTHNTSKIHKALRCEVGASTFGVGNIRLAIASDSR